MPFSPQVRPLASGFYSSPDPTVGRSPDGDAGNFAAAGGEGDDVVAGVAGVAGGDGGDSEGDDPRFESASERSRPTRAVLLPRGKSFPYWSRNWQRRVWTTGRNYLLLLLRRRRSVFSAPKLCGGAAAAAADNDAGCRWPPPKRMRRERLLCHGKYCNNWRWQRPRSRGNAGASCRITKTQ